MSNIISERVIEDILCANKLILAEVIGVEADRLNFIARQKSLDSGNLDLLYFYGSELLLIELKAVPFYLDIISQINRYYSDLIRLQTQQRLVSGSIKKIILVIDYKPQDVSLCTANDITLVKFNPKNVLTKYYEEFKEASAFLQFQSGDLGVWKLALLIPTLKLLGEGHKVSDIVEVLGRQKKTIYNRLLLASNLGLLTKIKKNFFLSDLGNQIVDVSDVSIGDNLNSAQIKLLTEFVKQNPFYSSTTYTLFTLIEAVFVLSKSVYPVPEITLQDYFVKSVGKTETWKTDKSKKTATNIFANYACELEFLAEILLPYRIKSPRQGGE
jgi:hypothetical protein